MATWGMPGVTYIKYPGYTVFWGAYNDPEICLIDE